MSENVYRYVRGLAEKKFGVSSLSPLQVLYGYAYVASMNDLTLSMYFRDDSDRRDIIAIRKVFDENRMDLSLIISAVPELENSKDGADDEGETKKVENEAKERDGSYSVNILKLVIDMPIPKLSLFRKGNDLRSVFFDPDNQSEDLYDHGDGLDSHKIINTLSSSGLDALKKNVSLPGLGSQALSGGSGQGFQTVFKKKIYTGASPSGGKSLSALTLVCTRLSEYLNEKMPGQREAVHLFVRNYFRSRLSYNEKSDRNVGGVMLLAGSAESELTRIVYLAARFLKTEAVRLRNPDEMWDLIEQCPGLFVLVENFESEDPEKLLFVQQVISEGYGAINVLSGRSVDYKQVIFVFTTDICKGNTSTEAVVDTLEKKSVQDPHRALTGLLGSFNPGNTVLFRHPDIRFRLSAINRGITLCEAAMSDEYGLKLKNEGDLVSLILYSCIGTKKWDAISGMSRQMIEDEIYEIGRHLGSSSEDLDELSEVRITVDTDDCDDEAKSLFEDNEKYTILYIGDEKDILNVNLPDRINLVACTDEGSVTQKAEAGDIRFVLTDISYGPEGDKEYLSIDDRRSAGMKIFELLSRKYPNLPVYIAEKEKLERHDRDVLSEAGAEDFVAMQDPAQISDALMKIGNMLYLQKKSDELESSKLILKYNTSQKINLSEKYAQIRFYDFRITKAGDSSEAGKSSSAV